MLKGYFSYLYSDTEKSSSKFLFSSLERKKNAALMDCGCWDGVNTKRYAEAIGTSRLYGIEIEKGKVQEAKAKGINAKVADLNKKLPYKDESFDVVVAYHVIEHLVNVRLFASEIHRVLKKGGYAVIGTPNLASWHNVGALILGLQPFSGPTIMPNHESEISFVTEINQKRMKRVFSETSQSLEHVKIMTARELAVLLRKAGFKLESVNGFGYYPLPPFIARFMSKINPGHSHYMVVKARK